MKVRQESRKGFSGRVEIGYSWCFFLCSNFGGKREAEREKAVRVGRLRRSYFQVMQGIDILHRGWSEPHCIGEVRRQSRWEGAGREVVDGVSRLAVKRLGAGDFGEVEDKLPRR